MAQQPLQESCARYRTIVADPPWRTHQPPALGRGTGFPKAGPNQALPYATMSVEDIAALPIPSLAAEDCHLYVWTINRYVEDTYRLVRLWGFTPSTLLVWGKTPMGMGAGGAYALTTEYILFARQGVGAYEERHPSSWWNWKRGEHSAKPEAFLDIVESVSPVPRLEMFARRARFGWDYWGDQSLGTAEMAA
jgi:N6-adenosine-specific RNA methylase IME4